MIVPAAAVRAAAPGTAAGPAGRAGRVLPGPGGGLPGLVRRGARASQLHHVRRGVPVRPGRGLRRLPGPEPARLRAAAVPGGAARAAGRGLLHLEPAVTAVDLHAPGRPVQGRGGARLQPADPAAPAGRLRRSRRPRLRLRVLAGPRGRAGTVLAGVPGVPDERPAGQAGVRLDRGARLPGPADTGRARPRSWPRTGGGSTCRGRCSRPGSCSPSAASSSAGATGERCCCSPSARWLVLLPPAMFATFDWRYQLPQLSLIPVAAVLGADAIGSRFSARPEQSAAAKPGGQP